MGSGPINDPPPSGPGRLWDKYDLAAYLGIPVGSVTKMITKRDCPRITWVGRHARFDPADVTVWVVAQKEKPASVKPGPLTVVGRVA